MSKTENSRNNRICTVLGNFEIKGKRRTGSGTDIGRGARREEPWTGKEALLLAKAPWLLGGGWGTHVQHLLVQSTLRLEHTLKMHRGARPHSNTHPLSHPLGSLCLSTCFWDTNTPPVTSRHQPCSEVWHGRCLLLQNLCYRHVYLVRLLQRPEL